MSAAQPATRQGTIPVHPQIVIPVISRIILQQKILIMLQRIFPQIVRIVITLVRAGRLLYSIIPVSRLHWDIQPRPVTLAIRGITHQHQLIAIHAIRPTLITLPTLIIRH